MANITPYIDQIQNATYGEEVRSSIINALELVNDDNESYQEIKEAVVDAKDTIEEVAENISDQISTADGLATTLEGDISVGQQVKSELEDSTTTAQQTKGDLDSSIQSGTTLQSDLEDLVASGSSIRADVEASAQTATQKATEASQSAGTAVQAKNETVTAKNTAVEASQTAVTKAGEALQSSTTATQKATEAGQSAQTAVQAKDTAVTKATEAGQSAQSASQSAQTATQKAQEALQSAQSVSDSATQIQTNKNDITELKADLNNLQADLNKQSLWAVGGLGSSGEEYNARNTSIRTKQYLLIDDYDSIVTSSNFITGYICLYTSSSLGGFIVRKKIDTSTVYDIPGLLATYPTAKYMKVEIGNVGGDVTHYDYISLMVLPCSPKYIAGIEEDIAEKQNKKCNNLIGNVFGRLYPVENVTTGTVLTFSTSDGDPIGASLGQTNIGFYDSNKEYISFYGFPASASTRTITLVDAFVDTKYIALYSYPPRVPIMVNFGNIALPYEEYFESAPTLTEKTNDIEERLKVADGTEAIKDLFSQSKYVYSATDSGVGTEKTLTLLHFTDVHGNKAGMEYAMSIYNKYASSIDDMLHTGDIVTANLSDGITNWINSGCATSVLNVIGNHDTEENLVLQAAGKDNVYNTIFAPYISNWGVTQPEGVDDSTSGDYHALYYYKDYDEAKVRLIVCDTNFWDSAQKTWLTNTLAGAKTLEYAVVLACHDVKQLTELTSANFSSYNGDGITENSNAYGNQPNDWLSPVKDFIDNGGHFVCILAGHNHNGHMGHMTYYPDIFVYVAQKSSMGRVSGTARISGEINQNTVSIVTINPKEKLFKLFSIGAEVDGHMRQRHVFCYNYETKTIISQW